MKQKNTLLFFLLLLITPLFMSAGSGSGKPVVNKGEAIEQTWATYEVQWEGSMIKKLKTTANDFQLFLKYTNSQFLKDKGVFFTKGFHNQLNANTIKQFFINLTNSYLPLYRQYAKAKAEFPNSVAEYTHQQGNDRLAHAPLGVCNPSCNNLDFSSGNLSGWNAFYASNNSLASSFSISALTGGPAGAVTRAALDPTTNTNQVAIMSGAGLDPVCSSIPVTPPIGNFSCRVGDSTEALQGVAEISNQFTVPAGNSMLTIQWAAVLENPASHTYYEQPWFSMQVLDPHGNPIPGCGIDFVDSYDSGSNLAGWQKVYYAPGGDTCYCRNWTTVFVPLSAYAGQCVTVMFEAADCSLGAHFGYAYVSCSCNTLSLLTSSPGFCGQPTITLTAPPGAASYFWTGPCITGVNNQQSVSVSCAGTYSVIVASTLGPNCSDTLSINVPVVGGGPPPKPFFTSDTVCAGFPTTFTNLSNPLAGPGVKFYWDFYNNGKYEDSTTSPTWTFTQGGTYLVTLHENINGCGNDTTVKVIVDSSSAPTFDAFGGCSGTPASFFMITVPTTGYEWNFGDPASGVNDTNTTSTFPSHLYATTGTYTVTLKTIGTHCPDSTTQVVTISASPTVQIKTLPYACGDSSLTFVDIDSTNIAEYDWEAFNSSGTLIASYFSVSSASASYTFPGPGTYSIILYAYNNPNFCEAEDSISITIGPGVPPVAAFNVIPDSVCLDKTTLFKDASTGGPSAWNWNFGDPASGAKNTSILQNPSHIFTSTGIYTVKLNVSGACGKDSITQVVTVTTPVANFSANAVCLNDSTKFADASTTLGGGTITNWSWNFGDGGTSTIQNPAHLYLTAGSYNVTLTVTNSFGCDSTMKLKVSVEAPPLPAFINTKACIGSTTQFTDKSTPTGTITNWSWNFGDGGTSTTQNPAHTYLAPGAYNVALTVINSSGCIDSVKEVVNVFPSPVIAFSADTLAGCAPLCVTFTDASSIVAPYKDNGWQWSFGDGGTSTVQNPNYCYKLGGTYNVTLIVSSDSGCNATSTIAKMISVYNKPQALFTYQPTMVTIMEPVVSFTSNSVSPGDSIISYSWLFAEDGSTSNLQDPTYTFKDTGLYCTRLAVTNTHGCVDTTIQCVDVQSLYTFYIPNAFTPNGDGLNDVFGPKGDYIMSFEMYIFDRWGGQLYHTTDITKPWDGSVNGNKAEEDTYVYLINVTDVHRQQHSYIGRVTLTR